MKNPVSSTDFSSLTPAALITLIEAERLARIAAEKEVVEIKAENARLKYLLKEFQRALYGRKSEKISADQLELALEDLQVSLTETETARDAGKSRGGATGESKPVSRKRNIGHLPKELERIERIIEPGSIQCPCGCGEMVKIREERSERLDIEPAKFRVIVTIRPVYACPKNCDGKPVQAPAPAHLIEGGLPTEGLIAHVIVSKFADHLPLYRQSRIYARESGLDLHRATLADWVGKAAFHLRPIVERMAEHLKASDKLFMDETPVPVLDPGRGRTRTGYFWALARDDRGWNGGDPPGVVFTYAPGRGGKHAEDILEGFNGILQVDGYGGYHRLARDERRGGKPLTLAYCWAHARRKLHDLADSSPIAREGLEQIARLYAIEKRIRGSSPRERLRVRQRDTRPLVEAFGQWLKEQQSRVSARSRLGEKLKYISRHWKGLNVFLSDGRVEADTNAVENLIRPIALGRKNALFAGHDEGGHAWALFASLIATCGINGVNPHDYLKATLEAVAAGHPHSHLDALMPWALNKASS